MISALRLACAWDSISFNLRQLAVTRFRDLKIGFPSDHREKAPRTAFFPVAFMWASISSIRLARMMNLLRNSQRWWKASMGIMYWVAPSTNNPWRLAKLTWFFSRFIGKTTTCLGGGSFRPRTGVLCHEFNSISEKYGIQRTSIMHRGVKQDSKPIHFMEFGVNNDNARWLKRPKENVWSESLVLRIVMRTCSESGSHMVKTYLRCQTQYAKCQTHLIPRIWTYKWVLGDHWNSWSSWTIIVRDLFEHLSVQRVLWRQTMKHREEPTSVFFINS